MVADRDTGVKMLRQMLKEKFGYDDFKSDIQSKATAAIYKGDRDVYVCMPTGGGKSLCFQLPAVMKKNSVAIVISPLLALIKNQVDFLASKHIKARSLNSKTSPYERKSIIADISSKKPLTKLLYVTPEMCIQTYFQNILERLNKTKGISYLIIDEAHCLSEWAHGFRSSYRKLGVLRQILPGVPFVALTATAEKEVVEDIFQSLRMNKPLVFSVPVFRRNLHYDVWFLEPLPKPFDHLKSFIVDALGPKDDTISAEKRSCGIIYCRKKEDTEVLAQRLTDLGIPTLAYHGSLNSRDRTMAQDRWTSGDVPVIAATCSFGMGVDKGSVRFVIHWTVPQSVATYYRESGRAGRDGKPAFCRIYFSDEELQAISFLTKEIGPGQTPDIAEAKFNSFQKMVSYCLEAKCRHAEFSKFFGDSPPRCNNRCDSCKDRDAVRSRISAFDLSQSNQQRAPRSNLDGIALPKYDKLCRHAKFSKFGDSQPMCNNRCDSRKDRDAVRSRKSAFDLSQSNQQRAPSTNLDGIALPKYDTFGGEVVKNDSRDRWKAREKREGNKFLKQQFALRRGANSFNGNVKKQNSQDANNAQVFAPESTDTKVLGLTIKAREHYYTQLHKALSQNYERFRDTLSQHAKSLQVKNVSRELEYETLCRTKLANKYKLDILNLTAAVRKSTKNETLYDYFVEYDSKTHVTSASSNAEDKTNDEDTTDDSAKSSKLLSNIADNIGKDDYPSRKKDTTLGQKFNGSSGKSSTEIDNDASMVVRTNGNPARSLSVIKHANTVSDYPRKNLANKKETRNVGKSREEHDDSQDDDDDDDDHVASNSVTRMDKSQNNIDVNDQTRNDAEASESRLIGPDSRLEIEGNSEKRVVNENEEDGRSRIETNDNIAGDRGNNEKRSWKKRKLMDSPVISVNLGQDMNNEKRRDSPRFDEIRRRENHERNQDDDDHVTSNSVTRVDKSQNNIDVNDQTRNDAEASSRMLVSTIAHTSSQLDDRESSESRLICPDSRLEIEGNREKRVVNENEKDGRSRIETNDNIAGDRGNDEKRSWKKRKLMDSPLISVNLGQDMNNEKRRDSPKFDEIRRRENHERSQDDDDDDHVASNSVARLDKSQNNIDVNDRTRNDAESSSHMLVSKIAHTSSQLDDRESSESRLIDPDSRLEIEGNREKRAANENEKDGRSRIETNDNIAGDRGNDEKRSWKKRKLMDCPEISVNLGQDMNNEKLRDSPRLDEIRRRENHEKCQDDDDHVTSNSVARLDKSQNNIDVNDRTKNDAEASSQMLVSTIAETSSQFDDRGSSESRLIGPDSRLEIEGNREKRVANENEKDGRSRIETNDNIAGNRGNDEKRSWKKRKLMDCPEISVNLGQDMNNEKRRNSPRFDKIRRRENHEKCQDDDDHVASNSVTRMDKSQKNIDVNDRTRNDAESSSQMLVSTIAKTSSQLNDRESSEFRSIGLDLRLKIEGNREKRVANENEKDGRSRIETNDNIAGDRGNDEKRSWKKRILMDSPLISVNLGQDMNNEKRRISPRFDEIRRRENHERSQDDDDDHVASNSVTRMDKSQNNIDVNDRTRNDAEASSQMLVSTIAKTSSRLDDCESSEFRSIGLDLRLKIGGNREKRVANENEKDGRSRIETNDNIVDDQGNDKKRSWKKRKLMDSPEISVNLGQDMNNEKRRDSRVDNELSSRTSVSLDHNASSLRKIDRSVVVKETRYVASTRVRSKTYGRYMSNFTWLQPPKKRPCIQTMR